MKRKQHRKRRGLGDSPTTHKSDAIKAMAQVAINATEGTKAINRGDCAAGLFSLSQVEFGFGVAAAQVRAAGDEHHGLLQPHLDDTAALTYRLNKVFQDRCMIRSRTRR